MFWQLILLVIKAIQSVLIPICFGCAWLLVALFIWNIWIGARNTFASARQMHQIPCSNCVFFTNDHRLKCTVHPQIANSESAIGCRDYQHSINSSC